MNVVAVNNLVSAFAIDKIMIMRGLTMCASTSAQVSARPPRGASSRDAISENLPSKNKNLWRRYQHHLERK